MSTEPNHTADGGNNKANHESERTPLYDLKLGKLQGSIFRNQTERGDYYSVSLFRPFTGQDGAQRVSYGIREQDIPAAMQLLEEAEKCIRTERHQAQEQLPENRLQVTRNA